MDNKDTNGLAIGVFKSAFCADVGATYIYEICENIIKKLLYAGTYHDDGLTILEGQQSIKQTILWLCNFQLQEEDEDLEELLPEEWAKWEEHVTVVEKEEFPYLDTKMYWENKTL
eukprot:13280725-Ditylum_brightwellii.AAC.1